MDPFTIMMIASTAFSAVSSISAGRQQESAYKAQAKREELNAREQELERRRKLVKAMASQNAARAAQGVAANQGSAAAMMREDIYQFERSQAIGAYNRDMAVSQLKNRGRNARRSGYMAAGSSLLDSGMRYYERGKP